MTIIKEKMLVLVSAGANSNKFYHVTLSDTGQVSKRYGRVGAQGVTNTENTGEYGFESVIRAKIRKGYKETSVVSNIIADAPNNESNRQKLSGIAKTALLGANGSNSVLDELVDTLVRLNNHDILETSGGMITVNEDGLMTTPLGLISSQSIFEAKNVLSKLEHTSIGQQSFVPLLENYLQLVPQKVGSRRGWYETFFNDTNTFHSQQDFLKQLSESLDLREERRKVALEAHHSTSAESTDEKYEKLFKLKINVLEDKQEFLRIQNLFESGKSPHHPSSRFKLKRVYILNDDDGIEAYKKNLASMGNEKTLWHGTRPNNVLSVLRHKLFIPPVSGGKIQIQGRLFGTGLYFGDAGIETNSMLKTEKVTGGASKALNYSVGGVWDRGPRESRCFMFLTKGVLGRESHPQGRNGHGNDAIQRSGKFDSIYAKAQDTYLRNDEIIIWNTEQISMRYLCEFEI